MIADAFFGNRSHHMVYYVERKEKYEQEKKEMACDQFIPKLYRWND